MFPSIEEYTFPDGKGPPNARPIDENRFISRHIIVRFQNVGIKRRSCKFPETTRHLLSSKNQNVFKLLRSHIASWTTMEQGFESLKEMISKVEFHILVDSQM